MKVLAIRGKNLASLEGEFVLDFTVEPLRSAGIFAITGPTGSGKSTLLDALCLALFDETPRNNKPSDGVSIVDTKENTISQTDCRNILRRGTCDGYAEVDFVSLSGEPFRSRWSVRRSREKADGKLQGTVITLHHLKTGEEQQGTKTELLKRIAELIGLTFDQFTRAVLLAQGDFATFLKAGKNEKADLLEKLTGTDVYSRISASIYEKTKAAEQEWVSLQDRIQGIELFSDEALAETTVQRQTLLAEGEVLKARLAELDAKIKWVADAQTLRAGVQQAQKGVDEAMAAIEAAKFRTGYLARLDAVQEIREEYSQLKRIRIQLAENRIALSKHEAEREENAFLFMQAAAKVALCETEQKHHQQELAELEPQIREARSLDIRISQATALLQEAKTGCEQTVQTKEKLAGKVIATESALREAVQKSGKITDWFTGHVAYKEVIPRVDLIVSLLDDVAAAKRQGENNAATLAGSREILQNDARKLAELQTEAERLNNLLPAEIAALRAKLVEGIPCPVCGSVHHPVRPVTGESLEEAELNRAKQVVNEAISKLSEEMEKRKNEHIRLQSVVEGYAAQVREGMEKLTGFLTDLPDWQRLFEEGTLQRSLRKVSENWAICIAEQQKTGEQIALLQTTLKLEQNQLTDTLRLLEEQQQRQKGCEADWGQLAAQRKKMLSGKSADSVEQEQLKKGRELAGELAKQIAQKSELTARSEKQAGIVARITEDIARLTEQNKSVQASVDAWMAARPGGETEEQLEELCSKESHWVTAEREALNRLGEQKTAALATLAERRSLLERHDALVLKPAPEEDPEEFPAQRAELNLQLEQAAGRLAELEGMLANHARGKERIRVYEKELEAKRTLSENWKKLNELFGSADGAKFKVLAQGYTLDVLLTYANKHLQELSKRYELQRIPDTLALQVADLDMLGEIRTVHSLSGGESFLISLALALGLSSLSSNRMKVESLFIDEGFGSLDGETLRVAMDALENLRTQGRKIGVISHVAEMTERIPTQIRVIKTVNGRSKIEIV